MQLLGSDIEDIVDKTAGRRLSLKSALMVGWQMIERLATLHALGYVHRDIKPDNMAVGVKEKANVVYLIDFGLAKPVDRDNNEAKHTGATVGTFRYMSVNSHRGLDLAKRDDIETLRADVPHRGQAALAGTPHQHQAGRRPDSKPQGIGVKEVLR